MGYYKEVYIGPCIIVSDEYMEEIYANYDNGKPFNTFPQLEGNIAYISLIPSEKEESNFWYHWFEGFSPIAIIAEITKTDVGMQYFMDKYKEEIKELIEKYSAKIEFCLLIGGA